MKDPPQSISHYRLERLLGSGSMGAVYRGVDKRDGSLVAVKLLHAHLAEDPTFHERFEQEAHVAALLRSPYTVQILEYGIAGNQCFIAMEYVHGRTVKEALSDGPIAPARAVRIASQVARSLEEAQARGVVHRDIKPDNILVRGDDAVKVADFGLARHASAAALTHSGMVAGTLAYAAPEQLAGEADHRSDIYSLGATLYCLLAGAPPFTGSLGDVATLIRTAPPPREPLAAVPRELSDVILRCLEKDPDDRFQSASDLAGALARAGESLADGDLRDATLPLSLPRQTEDIALDLSQGRTRIPFTAGGHRLTVHNRGGRAITVQLRGEDEDDCCDVRLAETVAVPARSSASVPVRVRPRKHRWRGRRETRIFTVYGSMGGGQPPVAVSGQFDDQPYGWKPAAGGAAVLGVGAVLAGAFTFGAFAGEAEKEPLRIGVLMPTTSAVSADYGTAYLNAARVAAGEINEAGGVLGRPVELVPADSAGNPDTAVAEARRLIAEEGVQAIVAEDSDEIAIAVAEQATEPQGILLLSLNARFEPGSQKGGSWFRPVASSVVSNGLAMARLVNEEGYRRVCSVYVSSTDVDLGFKQMDEAFVLASPGVEIVSVGYDVTPISPSGPGTTIRIGPPIQESCSGMDAIILFAWDDSELSGLVDPFWLLNQAVATGADVLLSDELMLEGVLGQVGWFGRVGWDVLDGARGSQQVGDNELHADFTAKYRELFGPLPERGAGTRAEPGTTAYDAVYLIALAAEQAGSTNAAAMRDAIGDIANEPGTVINPGEGTSWRNATQILSHGGEIDYEGASGPIQFDENGDNTRSNVAFWRVDAATRSFVTEHRFLLDTEKGTLEEVTDRP